MLHRVEVSDGTSYEIDGEGLSHVASILRSNEKQYPLPKACVIGIENIKSKKSRFYVKRKDGRTLYPISARVAMNEMAILGVT